MKIFVQDFSGHPFQVQLSRALADRHHDVLHTYCPDYASGHGALERRDGDSPSLRIEPIALGRPFDKYRLGRRLVQEVRYGITLARRVRLERPDVVLSCNEPLFSKIVLGLSCAVRRQPWVYWLQDLYSVAMRRELTRRAGRIGRLLGGILVWIEGRLLRSASAVVPITPAFHDWMVRRGIRQSRVVVIPNWAPLDELPYYGGDQGWFQRLGIAEGAQVVLYSGTLGRKHNADVLIEVAQQIAGVGAHMVVISEGPYADALRTDTASLDNAHVLPFQPWSELPSVLASAAVLVAILEEEAGEFSVPSKVLTYLCAGRPIVASLPADNLATQLLHDAGAGTVVESGDGQQLVRAILAVLADPIGGALKGSKGRAYAESAFNIEAIADQFESVFVAARSTWVGTS